MAFQFVHTETYSQKGKEGRGAGWVFDEAGRDVPLSHVEHPRPPEVVHGMTISQVRNLHAKMVSEAKTVTKKGQVKKIRNDQHTLVTVVMSHPALVEDIEKDPILAAQVKAWEDRNVEWLKAIYGDQLVSVLRHKDEPHAHLHAYILPSNPEMRARLLHPGCSAKDAVFKASVAAGDDVKTANKVGDKAYRTAMREYQDSYYEAVGIPSGLTRIGPGRRRLSTAAWTIEKEQAKSTAKSIAAAEEAEARVKKAQKQEAKAIKNKKITIQETTQIKKDAQEKIKEAELISDKNKSLGGKINSIFKGLLGENVEETIQIRVAEEVAKVQKQADKKIDSLKGEISFQNELIHEIRAKNKKGFRVKVEISEAEIEKLVQARVAEILRNPEAYNTRNI